MKLRIIICIMSAIGAIYIIFLLLFIEAKKSSTTEETLVQVHALFRHGDRTPDFLTLVPTDPYRNEKYYPYGYGELTNKGKQTEYQLGKKLRNRYDHFLGKLYTPQIVYARSTDFSRTKMSLELVLAGLFPPVDEQIWNTGMNWQPVPYDVQKIQNDGLLLGTNSNFYKHCYKNITMPNNNNIEEYQKYFDYISKHTGTTVASIADVYSLYFGLTTEQEWGFKLPEWTQSVFPGIMEEMAIKFYSTIVSNDEQKKIISGMLLKKIIEDTKGKIAGSVSRKIFLYSAHEFNVACLLISLDIFKPQIPAYGSCIIVEVHRINHVYGFKVFYQANPASEAELLRLPGCEEDFCPLDQFVSQVEHILPSDEFYNKNVI